MRLSSIVALLLSATAAMAASPAAKPFAFGAVRFEENRGQTDPSVRFLSRAPGQRVFLTRTGVVFASVSGASITMRFEGAGDSRWEAVGAPSDSISYYIGNDPSKWIKGAPEFDRVVWRNAYPGIDLAFHGDGVRLEYDLVLAPGADASAVRIRFDSPAITRIKPDGGVEIAAAGDTLLQHSPQLWQESAAGERRSLRGRFVPDGINGLRLSLAPHEPSKPVVVDPVLEFASYLGGENDDEVVALTDGVVAGNTRSVAFPGTSPVLRTSRDVFLSGTYQANTGGSSSTGFYGAIIIGGSGDDQIAGIAVSTLQRGYYLAGTTTSTDFPVVGGLMAGGSQKYNGGASDGFVAFIEISGLYGYLGFANYIGGSGADRINAFTGAGLVFAYAGVTDSPDLPVANAPQMSLAGGKDAFYGIFSLVFQSTGTLGYLGGSGDDVANAVAFRNGIDLWIGGSTASGDFPFVNGALSGPSDGFLAVMSFSPSLLTNTQTPTLAAYRIGGSGDDSVNALVATPYSAPYSYNAAYVTTPFPIDGIGFAGSTTSPDLPVLNAAQPQPGGGSDGFAGMWDRPSATPRWMTFAGGSGPDQFNAIAQNWAGDLYVGGSTSSVDLPVVDALQPANGGGQDGMFAVYDYTGVLQQLTYFGGSGDDNIKTMWMDYNYIARMGGSTNSTNLPENGASQGPGGGLDGFVANIGSDYFIGPTSLIMPKDGQMTFSIRSARTTFRPPVTYQSADPSRVRLVYLGQSFSQVTAAPEDNMQVEALSDSGEVDITVSSPGYATKTIHVNLYPGVFAAFYGIVTSTSSPGTLALSTWGSPVNLDESYCAIDPVSGAILGYCMGLRADLPFPAVQWSSSDTTVIQVVYTNGFPQILIVGPGTATLTFSVNGYNAIQTGQAVTVAAPAPVAPTNPFFLGKDLAANLPTSFVVNGSQLFSGYRGTLTAASSDPTKLLLAPDTSTPGSASLSVTMSNGIPNVYAQALTDSGTVQVFLSSDQFPGQVAIDVNLEPAVLRWGVYSASSVAGGFASSIPLTMGGQAATLQYTLQGVSGSAGNLRPGAAPLILTLANSDPTIVELNRLTMGDGGGANPFTLSPLKAGSSTLTLTDSDSNIPVTPATLPVVVQPSTTSAPALPSLPASLNVGNGLQGTFSFNYTTGGPSQTVTVSVDDPTVATVSSSATTAGTNQITFQTGLSNVNYTVYVQGQGSSGTTNIHVQFPQGSATIPVKLFPSGAGFSRQFYTSTVQGYSLEAQVSAYYLDPNTGIGIVAQTPNPGPGIKVDFSAGSPIQFYRQSAILTAASPTANVDITAPPTGQQVPVTVAAEGGGPTVSPVTATATAGTLAPNAPFVLTQMTLAQGELRAYTVNAALLPATVTSSDPTNVLLAASPTSQGAASIQLSTSSSTVYISSVGSSGLYTVEFDTPGAAIPSVIQVGLVPLQFAMYSSAVAAGASSQFQASVNAATLAPGVAPLHFTAQTSDPTIATVAPAAFDVTGSATFADYLTVTGVSAGTTQLIVTGPSNVYVNPPSLTIAVGMPAPVVAPTYTVGVNLQGGATLDLGANFANPNGAIITLTSSDPTIVLLSRSATTVGTASVVVAVPAGTHLAQSIYVQALAQGTATIQVTAGAPAEAVARVSVQPSWVSCASGPISLAAGSTQTLYCFANYTAGLTSQTGVGQFQSIGPRAGLSNLTIGLASSAPNVFTLASATQTLSSTSTGDVLRAVATGTGTLQVTPPPGFGPSPNGSESVAVTVTPATIGIACQPQIALGQDTQITCQLGGPAGAVTARSSDPSLLVVSANPTTPGAATATATASSASNQLTFTLQALASAGTAEVVFSAPGYQDVRVAVALRPSQFAIQLLYGQQSISMLVGNSAAFTLGMYQGGSAGTPRAGLTVPLSLSVDNPNIASLTPAQLNFAGTQASSTFTVKALAAGSTLLRLSAPGIYQVTGSPVLIGVSQ